MLGDFLIFLKNSWIGQLYQISYSYEVFLFVVAYLSAFFVIKKRWLKIVFLNALHLILVFILIRAYLLNEDICINQGRKLSDQEKIDAAVDDLLRSYPPTKVMQYFNDPTKETFVYGEKWNVIDNPGVNGNKNRIIYYFNRDHFYQQNPNCCALSDTEAPLKWKGLAYDKDTWGLVIDLHARVRWLYSSWVHITYQVKYLNQYQQELSIVDEIIVPVSQCGHVLKPKSIVEDY